MTLTWLMRTGVAMTVIGSVWALWPRQDADTDFVPRVGEPAVSDLSPVVLIDEGHFNVHTAGGRFEPFARLLHADGFRVLRGEGRVTREALRAADVFVTANPLGLRGALQQFANLAGFERVVQLHVDAFADDEIAVLVDWVHNGGKVLIAADHAPAGLAARRLAAAFGVGMTSGWAEDIEHYDTESGNPGTLVFSRANGLLSDHPTTRGRHQAERIDSVMTFTGQALVAPAHGEVILRLAPTARQYPFRVSREAQGQSAAGLVQAVAVRHGRGRVVVFGEAAALTAQRVELPDGTVAKVGMNREGVDNAQLVLNVMHWLVGLIN